MVKVVVCYKERVNGTSKAKRPRGRRRKGLKEITSGHVVVTIVDGATRYYGLDRNGIPYVEKKRERVKPLTNGQIDSTCAKVLAHLEKQIGNKKIIWAF